MVSLLLDVLKCERPNTLVLHLNPSVTNGGEAALQRRQGKHVYLIVLFIVRGEYRLWALPQVV